MKNDCCSTSETTSTTSYNSDSSIKHVNIQQCECIESEDCNCNNSESKSILNLEEESELRSNKEKEKLCMAHNIEDDDSKVLSSIKMLVEGEMKEKMLDAFLQTMHKEQGRSCSKKNQAKTLFVDGSYEKNTRSFQRNKEHTKPRSLTLGEVST